jgi:long-chain acyl-CoA synthetase
VSDRTVYGLFIQAAQTYGNQPALYYQVHGQGKREWRNLSWLEYKQAVEEVAAGLHALGVFHGDIVALDSETRLEFYLADAGVIVAGAIAAALYTSYPVRDHLKTLERLAPKVVFVESATTLAKLLSAAEPPLDTGYILLTGEPPEGADALTLEQLRSAGRLAIAQDPELLASLHAALKPSDGAILYLTSGATGEPKMGLVSHSAIYENCDMAPKIPGLDLGPHHRTIAFLPAAHITQRLVVQYVPIRCGMPVYFSEGLSRLPHEIKDVRPTFFVAPPRVWERMYTSICTELKKRPGFVQRLFWGALGLGIDIHTRRIDGREAPGWMIRAWRLADRLIFSTIRERLGGELKFAISGAAPLGKDLADFYAAIGMPIHEGYGLTEGGVVCLNPIGRPKSGSIGKPLPGVEVRLAPDGELTFRSPTLFTGYWQDQAATDAILRDGWLHTGDIAEVDSNGFIFITGRKKEVIVSSNGKKIYPSMVEGLFKMEPLLHQVLLIGDKLPYVAALFTLNTTVLESLKEFEEFRGKPLAEVVQSAPIQAAVKKIVAKVNRQLAPFEQIRKWHILDRDFTIEAGEITPTMKVRRSRVLENHRHAVSGLYGNRDADTAE